MLMMFGVATMAWGEWDGWTGDTNDTDMPIYYYTSETEASALPTTSFAQRTLYDKDSTQGTGATSNINMGFQNTIFLDQLPLLFVELSDQDLFWKIFDRAPGGDIGTRTIRYLTGSRRDNQTGITIRVYSTNDDDGGAELRFSEAEDLVGQGRGEVLPTFYGFTGTATTVPAQNDLIRAPDMNTPANLPASLRYIPAGMKWVRYMWSAVDIMDTNKKDTYRDPAGFFIDVRNRPWQ